MCSRNTTASTQHLTLTDQAGNVFVVRKRPSCPGCSRSNVGMLTNSRGQSVTTSGVKRTLQQIDYANCVRAQLVARSATGCPWDQDRSTPSGIQAGGGNYQAIIANQQKRLVQAAQACQTRQPSQSVGRAPVFTNPRC